MDDKYFEISDDIAIFIEQIHLILIYINNFKIPF